MRKMSYYILFAVLTISILFSSCSWAPRIPQGVYRGSEPYMEIHIFDSTSKTDYSTLEYNGQLYETRCIIDHDQTLIFLDPVLLDECRDADKATVCHLKYYFYDNKNVMILKDRKTDETLYVLSKVE